MTLYQCPTCQIVIAVPDNPPLDPLVSSYPTMGDPPPCPTCTIPIHPNVPVGIRPMRCIAQICAPFSQIPRSPTDAVPDRGPTHG